MNAAFGFGRAGKTAQRLRPYKARVELLEQRLPPGDAWLGSFLGSLLLAGPGTGLSGLHDLEGSRSFGITSAQSEELPAVLTFSSGSSQTAERGAGQGVESPVPTATIQSGQAFAWDSFAGKESARPSRAPEAFDATASGQGGAGGVAVAAGVASPVSISYTVWTSDTREDAARLTDTAVQTLSTRQAEDAAPAEELPPSPVTNTGGKEVGPAQEPEFFQHMTQEMRDNHGRYDNAYTAMYEAWLAGEPYEQEDGPATREYGADVRMSNAAFAGNQNEFQIDINPVDTRFAIGSSNDGRTAGVGIYRTTDGGQTWTAQDAPIGTAACCDPAVAYGSDGVVYVGILDTSPSGQITLRSTDNGETWQQQTFAPLPDRNNIAVDPRDSNIVYITYSGLDGPGMNRIRGYRSTDGGLTWGNPFFIGTPAPPQGYQQSSQPRVASDGTLYVGYQQYTNSGQGCNAGVQNIVARSGDGGQTWEHFTWDIRQGGACTPAQAGRGIFCINAGSSFRSRSHPILSVHPTNPQIVYVVYSGGDLDTPYTCAGSTGYHGDTLFRKSTDGGVTFSDAIKINTDGPGSDQYYPWMDVAPNGRVWVGWNDRRNDPQNFRSRWYQAYSDDQGATWTEEMVADGDTQPSTFIGDYHGLAAENDRVLGMWFDSRSTASGDPYTDPNFQFGLAVANSVPARNDIVATQLTQFVLTLTDPYDPASVDASDLTVNAVPATSVQQTNPTTLTFQFASSPITQEGAQAMAVAAGAILRQGDGNPILSFDAGFRYDAIRLTVDSTDPAVGARVDVPFTSLRVNLNEPYDPATVGTNDLTLTQGTVTAATPVGPQTIEYTLSGITVEGVLTARLAAGALTDPFGNPSLAFEGSYTTDISAIEFPPLVSRGARGSLVHEATVNGLLAPSDDYDIFYTLVDPHQTLSVAATPTTPAGLWPYVALYALPPGDFVFLGDAFGSGPNQSAVLQPVSTVNTEPAPIYYLVLVAGIESTGGYRLRLTLNAAAEAEPLGGPPNDTPAAAQNLDAAFGDLVPGRAGPSRAAVAGRADLSAGPLPDEVEPNNTRQTANVAVGNFGAHAANLFQLGVKGAVTPGADVDWVRLGALDAGDVISVSMGGTGAMRGTLANAILELYRGPDTAPVLVATDDNSGPVNDALIWRFQVPTSDTYYVRGRSTSTVAMGTYDLNVLLENAGAEPLTGGTRTQEVEPNNTAPTATDFSDSWRRVQHEAQTRAAVAPAGDTDFFEFRFNAGDLVSVHLTATGGTVDTRFNLLNAAGTIIGRDDGTSVNAAFRDSLAHAFIIPTTGTYYLQVLGTGTGTYTATTYLSAGTPPPAPTFGYDYYSFTLAAGDTATLALLGLPSNALRVEITDAGGNVLAAGERTATNFTEGVANFVAPAAGLYYARVFGGLDLDYSLALWRNANFDAESNDAFPSAQPLTSRRVGNRQWVAGYVSQGSPDWDVYRVAMAEGGTLTLATTTPADQGGEFVNAFDPLLIVYDAGGNAIAFDDNGAADGRNAVLSYPIPPGGAGTYFIQVLPSFQTPAFTLGEYVLEVEGTAGTAPSPGGDGAVSGLDASRTQAAVAATLLGGERHEEAVPEVQSVREARPTVAAPVGEDRPLTAVQVDHVFAGGAASVSEGFGAPFVGEYEL